METVRALLRVLPGGPTPSARPDAILLDAQAATNADAFGVARATLEALLPGAAAVYLHTPPIASGVLRELLLAALAPGVYGVSIPGPASVDQLRYVDGLLEDVEPRVGIRRGLTALAIWIDSAKSLGLAEELAGALAQGSERTTWIGLDAAALAADLGVDPASPTIAYARARVVVAAAARSLPAVEGGFGAPVSAAGAELAHAAGLRGAMTDDPAAVAGLQELFPEAPAEPEPEQPATSAGRETGESAPTSPAAR